MRKSYNVVMFDVNKNKESLFNMFAGKSRDKVEMVNGEKFVKTINSGNINTYSDLNDFDLVVLHLSDASKAELNEQLESLKDFDKPIYIVLTNVSQKDQLLFTLATKEIIAEISLIEDFRLEYLVRVEEKMNEILEGGEK